MRKRVKTLTLGERLVKLRSDRNMSVADVSRSTGIQIAYLEYLEQGMFKKLPAEVYVRGFLRRYAEYLGVSDESILRQYDREQGMNQSLSKNEDQEDQNSMIRGAFKKLPSVLVTPKRITLLVSFLLAIFGFLYVYTEYRSFVSEPILLITEPVERVTQVETPSILIVGSTDPDSKVFINDQLVLVSEGGEFREKVNLQNGVNTVTIRSVNRFSKEAKKVYSIDAKFEDVRAGEDITSEDIGTKVGVRIGERASWILISIDGEQKVSEVAQPRSKWEFTPKESMLISAGDGSNVYVTIGENREETTLSHKEEVIDTYILDKEKSIFIPMEEN